MRTDLLFAGALGSFALLLGLMGFFVFDWSRLLVGVLAAVFVVADGYFLYSVVQTAKENPAKKPPIP